jgi:hypothetical protein
MEVGDHGDGQLAARRPGRQRARVAGDDEALRLDGGGVSRRRRHGQAGQRGCTGDNPAPRHAYLRATDAPFPCLADVSAVMA